MKLPRFSMLEGIFLAFLAIILYSCHKELKPTPNSSEKPALSLLEAQNWFDLKYNQNNYLRTHERQSGFALILQGGITPD